MSVRRSNDRERGEAREAADAEEERLGGGPAGTVGLRDREHDRGETRRREDSAAEVEPAPARLPSVGRDDLQCGDRESSCDGEIDVEDHAPVGELGEDTTDEHTDRSAGAADCSPGGESLCPLVALEGGHDDRESRRGEHCCPETLARPRGEQDACRARHRGRERRGREDAEAGQEHSASPEEIGCTPPEEQQAPEDERVARDRPADVGAGQVQVSREARKGDVHRRDVENDHQLGDEQDEQQRPALLVRSRRLRAGVVTLECGVGVPSGMHLVVLSKLDSSVWISKADTSV